MRCPGRDKFNNQCNVFLRPNEKYCWKHIVSSEDDVNKNTNTSTSTSSSTTKQVKINVDEKRLQKLANDDQNIHTPEIQIPLMNAITKILAWGRGMHFDTNIYLPTLIASMMEDEEFNTTSDLAMEHLANIFNAREDTPIFNTNYLELSLFVWARINYNFQHDREKLMLLRARFFQEVSESIGQCLNGNIARLINVFSGIDDEMSIQLASITKNQFVELLLDKLDLLTPEMAMQRTYQLLLKAQIPDDEWGPWIDAVRERKGIELIPMWEQREGNMSNNGKFDDYNYEDDE